ncbi:MAG: 16S rRNA (guanine(527)-N(7))-methyltransferase RsmG [Thermoguttaceae bacterium]|nr:16S rRNA (guanine(527)-N(7))-methyltransferase RsmG [Thermoguttaceae bacterium]MDW8079373.1 16S rRNA (guanine(527)-N(7))-methyltransferase RsmG [Thermoguttaceae bacterium]
MSPDQNSEPTRPLSDEPAAQLPSGDAQEPAVSGLAESAGVPSGIARHDTQLSPVEGRSVVEAVLPAGELELIDGATLADVLARYQISLPPDQIRLLDRYRRLVWDWNQKINLTRHTDLEKFVTRDVLDSVAVAELLEPEELVLDVGTGAGVPGVILAIIRPDLRVYLCDSVAKKARAVDEIVRQLGLATPVAAARVQDLLGQHTQFNTLIGRAIGSMREVLKWLRPHWRYFDRLLLIKGRSWVKERGEARHYGMMHGLALRKLKEYDNPANGAYNVILQVCPEDRIGEGKKCRLRELRSHRPKLPPLPVSPMPAHPGPKK